MLGVSHTSQMGLNLLKYLAAFIF